MRLLELALFGAELGGVDRRRVGCGCGLALASGKPAVDDGEHGVADGLGLEPPAQIVPAVDRMDRFVADNPFEEACSRIPVNWP